MRGGRLSCESTSLHFNLQASIRASCQPDSNMVLFQPAPMAGRAALRRLVCQISRTSLSATAATYYSASIPSSLKCHQCHSSQPARSWGLPLSTLASPARSISSPLRQEASGFMTSLRRSISSSSSKQQAPTTATTIKPICGQPAENDTKPKSSSFPETNSKSVAYWLLGSAASVFGIVVFGGLTRLTESGYVYLIPPRPPHLCRPLPLSRLHFVTDDRRPTI